MWQFLLGCEPVFILEPIMIVNQQLYMFMDILKNNFLTNSRKERINKKNFVISTFSYLLFNLIHPIA